MVQLSICKGAKFRQKHCRVMGNSQFAALVMLKICMRSHTICFSTLKVISEVIKDFTATATTTTTTTTPPLSTPEK